MNTNEHDPLILLRDVSSLPWMPRRQGKPVHVTSVHRWATKGVNGVKLRTVQAGGARATTEAWVREFFEALSGNMVGNGTDAPAKTVSPTPSE